MLTSDSEDNGHTMIKLQCLKQCILVPLVLAGMAVNGLIKYHNIKSVCVCV